MTHKGHKIYLKYHSVCPLVGIGTPPPLPLASVSPTPTKEEGVHTRLRVRGWGSSNSDDWRESLVLCLLCRLTSHIRPDTTPQTVSNSVCINTTFMRCFSFLCTWTLSLVFRCPHPVQHVEERGPAANLCHDWRERDQEGEEQPAVGFKGTAA
jgi:hypothetical protein